MARDDIEFLRIFALSSDPVLTALEIANDLEMSQQGAYSRLRNFEADGLVNSKKVGAKARVFWLTDEGKNYVSDFTSASE